jgi:hypothetical protein
MIVQCKDCDRQYERSLKRCPGCGSWLSGPVDTYRELGFRDGYHAWPAAPPAAPDDASQYWDGHAYGAECRRQMTEH